MSYIETVCPNCGLATVFNDGRKQCYCINCGFLIRAEDVKKTPTAPVIEGCSNDEPVTDDGSISINITVPEKNQQFVFFIDGNEVLSTRGGSYNIRTTPGRHRLQIRQNLFAFDEYVILSEGTRISVTIGMMGLKTRIE